MPDVERSEFPDGKLCVASGWGYTREKGTTSHTLRFVTVCEPLLYVNSIKAESVFLVVIVVENIWSRVGGGFL